MKRTLTIFGATVLAAGMMFAQGQANHARHRMEALNLNDAQKAQAKAIFGEAKQSAAPLRAELKQDREAMANAVKSNDRAQIEKLSTAEGRVLGKLMAVRTEAMAKFYQTLTPEQKAKAEQLHQQMKEHRHATRS